MRNYRVIKAELSALREEYEARCRALQDEIAQIRRARRPALKKHAEWTPHADPRNRQTVSGMAGQWPV